MPTIYQPVTPEEQYQRFHAGRMKQAISMIKRFGPIADRSYLVDLHATVVDMLEQTSDKENPE